MSCMSGSALISFFVYLNSVWSFIRYSSISSSSFFFSASDSADSFFSFFFPSFLSPSAEVGSSLILSSCMRATMVTTSGSLLHWPPDRPCSLSSAFFLMICCFSDSSSSRSALLMPADSVFFGFFSSFCLFGHLSLLLHVGLRRSAGLRWGARLRLLATAFFHNKVALRRIHTFGNLTGVDVFGVVLQVLYLLGDGSSLFLVFLT